jgi:hypothetical protein
MPSAHRLDPLGVERDNGAMSEEPPDFRRALDGRLDPLPADLVAAVGEALFGRDWVAPLARALNVADRTVHRWKAGDARATPRIAPELLQLLDERAAAITAARKRLRAIASQATE